MDYVLYVGYDRRDATKTRFCPGSRRAIELVDEAGAQDRVMVQSVDALRESVQKLPTWLNGTPTLVCRSTKKAMRGTVALEYLQSQLVETSIEPVHAESAHGLDGMVSSSEAMHLGIESNFEPLTQDDPKKYEDSKKVSEDDLQRMLERRKAIIPPS